MVIYCIRGRIYVENKKADSAKESKDVTNMDLAGVDAEAHTQERKLSHMTGQPSIAQNPWTDPAQGYIYHSNYNERAYWGRPPAARAVQTCAEYLGENTTLNAEQDAYSSYVNPN